MENSIYFNKKTDNCFEFIIKNDNNKECHFYISTIQNCIDLIDNDEVFKKQFKSYLQDDKNSENFKKFLFSLKEYRLWNNYQKNLINENLENNSSEEYKYTQFRKAYDNIYDNKNYFHITENFLKNNSTELFRWSAATILVPLSLYIVQQVIQDRIAKADRDKALISAQLQKEAEKNKYQQDALDKYIDTITNLFKENNKNEKDKNKDSGQTSSTGELSVNNLRIIFTAEPINPSNNSNNSSDSSKADSDRDTKNDVFKTIAKAKTLTTLYLLYLDKERRNLLISFLRDANYLSSKDEARYKKIRFNLDNINYCLNQTENDNQLIALNPDQDQEQRITYHHNFVNYIKLKFNEHIQNIKKETSKDRTDLNVIDKEIKILQNLQHCFSNKNSTDFLVMVCVMKYDNNYLNKLTNISSEDLQKVDLDRGIPYRQ